jgi:hypothetical protein
VNRSCGPKCSIHEKITKKSSVIGRAKMLDM